MTQKELIIMFAVWIFFIMPVVMYALGAFHEVSLHLKKWSSDCRFLVVFIYVLAFVASVIVFLVNFPEKI